MKIVKCSKCIIPSTYTGVKFDKQGVCSVCHNWDTVWGKHDFKNGEEQFLRNFPKRQNKYDCIVPFSGGKDSSYLLYYIKERLGLNPLAVNLNNYFQTPIIKNNIDLVIKKLGVDLVTFSPDFDNWCELMRRSFIKSMIPCIPCDVGIYALAYRMAMQTNTKVIVFPGGKLASQKKPGRAIIMYKTLEIVARHFDKENNKIDLSNFEVTQKMIDSIDVVYFGNYFDWQEEVVLKTCIEKLDWKMKGDQHTRIDCIFVPVVNYLYSKRAHMSKQCTRLSAMVRDGQLTRQEALDRDRMAMMKRMPKDFHEIMSKINLTTDYIDKQIEGKNLMKPLWYD